MMLIGEFITCSFKNSIFYIKSICFYENFCDNTLKNPDFSGFFVSTALNTLFFKGIFIGFPLSLTSLNKVKAHREEFGKMCWEPKRTLAFLLGHRQNLENVRRALFIGR